MRTQKDRKVRGLGQLYYPSTLKPQDPLGWVAVKEFDLS